MSTTTPADRDTAAVRGRTGSGGSLALCLVAAALSLVLAACSSSTSTSGSTATSATSATSAASSAGASTAGSSAPSYPAGKEQICSARDDLKTSLAALTNPSLLLGGTAGITAAVKQVQTDLDAVAAAGKDDYKPQVTAVQSALTDLQTAVGTLGDGGGTANITAVGSAIAAVGTAAGSLFTQLQTSCTA